MKTKSLMTVGLLSTYSIAFAQENNILDLTKVNCQNETCEIDIVNSEIKSIGKLFLAKNVNPENGVSLFTAEVVNSTEKLNDSHLIVCLKSYICKLYSSKEGFHADYAYLNNKFYGGERKKRNIEEQYKNLSFKIRSDQISIFEGNEPLEVNFPLKLK